MTVHDKIARLRELRILEDELQCAAFSALCEELAEEQDPALLPQLLAVLTDRTHHHEVMVDLKKLVESYPLELYADALVRALPGMLGDARGWAKALLRTLLQTPAHAALVRAARARASDADRAVTAPVFREIAVETPRVAAIALELAG